MGFSHWNYRVVEDTSGTFRIMEVFYNEDDEIFGWTDAHAPEGDTMEELMADRGNQADCVYEQWLHIYENEDSGPTLGLWREDGNYESSD